MTPSLLRFSRSVDRMSLWTGKVVAWLIGPMVLALGYEVIARYLFMAPTVWAYDLTYMLYGTFFMLGSACTLVRQGHIRTDTFYGAWSARTQGVVDSICYVIFIPTLVALLWVGWTFFLRSFFQGERIVTSPWMPIVWPFKFVIPLTAAMLLLQSISELIKSLTAARTGAWP